jgi:hypothetical protein
MTVKELKEIQGLLRPTVSSKAPLIVGEKVFIRTVTHYYTGKIKAIVGQWLILDEAAWIADTGRFHDFLKDGKCNEYEGFISDVKIPLGSIIDVTEWGHSLFKGQK